jgi:hypothetical protein
MRTIRSARAAIPASCVTTTSVVARSARTCSSRSSTPAPALESRAPVGSSARMMGASLASARAIATRCRSPPESSAGRLSSRWARPTVSSSARARATRSRRATRSSNIGTSTFSSAVRFGRRLCSWNTMPTWRARKWLRSDSRARSWPATTRLPESGRSSAAIRCTRVDLPQPEGPMMATCSPPATDRLMPSSAVMRPAS